MSQHSTAPKRGKARGTPPTHHTAPLAVGALVTGPHGHPVHPPETWRVVEINLGADLSCELGSIYLRNGDGFTYDATLDEFRRYARVVRAAPQPVVPGMSQSERLDAIAEEETSAKLLEQGVAHG